MLAIFIHRHRDAKEKPNKPKKRNKIAAKSNCKCANSFVECAARRSIFEHFLLEQGGEQAVQWHILHHIGARTSVPKSLRFDSRVFLQIDQPSRAEPSRDRVDSKALCDRSAGLDARRDLKAKAPRHLFGSLEKNTASLFLERNKTKSEQC